ncbi:MAG TPA: HlyD family secretion protein [Prolixibacteraceae bacterium]|jgi:membrane fusion protein (multidrug efflux system)|nr:HlyD family secretion protein [Prolixibacteraceae bacterium]
METNQVRTQKNGKVYIPLILIVLLLLGGGIYWYIDYSKYIKSDDAHIDADNVSVSPKSLGRISQIFAQEGDSVKQGQLIAILDSTDLVAQKSQAMAGKLLAQASIAQAQAKYEFDLKNNKVLEVSLDKAKDDFNRAKTQFEGNVITQEQFDHAKKAVETAQAQLEAARSQAKVSQAQINSAKASVENADAQINVIRTQINNTNLYAPSEGVIGKRWLLPGDVAQPGQSIFTIVNNRKLWVSVFLEETKLGNLHNGQATLFTLDAYPDVTFTGKILTIASNTAATFSLIPASNASGNFTKVTQRVQLKISIDGTTEGKNLSIYHFFSGMSAVVKIIR